LDISAPYCASPREGPKNFPVTILIDGSQASGLAVLDVKSVSGDVKITCPEEWKKTFQLADDLQAVHLPVVDEACLPPWGYFLNLEITVRHGLSPKKQVSLPVTLADYEVLRPGQILFMGQSRLFVVLVTPATAYLYSKTSRKCLAWLGFPETMTSACLCGDTLMVLSGSGFLHCYSLWSFYSETFCLTDKPGTEGYIQAFNDHSVYWHASKTENFHFVYTRGELSLVSTERPAMPATPAEVVFHAAEGVRLVFSMNELQYRVERQDREEILFLTGIPPENLLVVPGSAELQPCIWMQKGVALVVYDWKENGLRVLTSDSIALPSRGIRFGGQRLFYVHDRIMGADRITPFGIEQLPIFFHIGHAVTGSPDTGFIHAGRIPG